MAQDNWLSTDAMIAEVCDDAVRNYGGTSILAIRCPDKEIEAKVRKYLNSKRGGKTIDTYVGGINDSVKTIYEPGDNTPEGDDTPVKKRKKRVSAPVETPEPVEEEVDISGLVGDDPDLGGLV